MKKHTLIIGPRGSGKSTKARELILCKKIASYADRDKYIAFKFPEGTEFLIFDGLDVINDKYDLNFINKLSQQDDAIIKTISGEVKKVAMPEIIVTATCNINDPLPEIFTHKRWIVLTCNS